MNPGTSPLAHPEPVSVETSSRLMEGRHCDDGYDFMEAGTGAGWLAVAGWGQDGWDLGDWPYLVYLFRDASYDTGSRPVWELVSNPGLRVPPRGVDCDVCRANDRRFQRASYCEGDIRVETFASAEARQAATDADALAQWRREGEPWVAGVTDDAVPDRLRGPYRPRAAS